GRRAERGGLLCAPPLYARARLGRDQHQFGPSSTLAESGAPMRLNKITLNNFRSFECLEVDLHPRLTVLVGNNGAGKTAILDAIAVGLSPVLRHLSSANQRLKGVGIKDSDFHLVSQESRSGRETWVASNTAQVILEGTGGLLWD